METLEKRSPRSYKIKHTPYVKASQRAKKEFTNLANLVEMFVELYADGATWNYSYSKKNKVLSNKTIQRTINRKIK